MGGDEFLLLITKTDQTKARKVVEDIVAYIEAIILKKHHLQVAVGLHVLERPTKDIYAAIKCADDDMYAHKQKKKQQV